MTTLGSLQQYGNKFQIKVIGSLIADPKFLRTIHDTLQVDYFESPANKWMINEILKYFENYNTSPTINSLTIELKKLDNEVLKVAVHEILKQITNIPEDDRDYVENEFSLFCRNQALKGALLESVDLLNLGQFDEIRHKINLAIQAGKDKNVGHEYEKDIETRYRNDDRSPIPFPWKAFNINTQNGYGAGDLVLIFGNPKGGKSWSVVAMAGYAVQMGYNVVYYALELTESYVGKRFDAYFTGIDVSEIANHRKEVEEAVSKLKGKLVIKEYSPKRASLDTIESHLNQLKDTSDFVPHAIFIDYLDYLKNRKTRKEKKDDLDDIYVDAKGLAKELRVPIISPSQANRSGSEKDILEGVHIGGSFEKLMVADIVLSLARTRLDRLKGTGKWHFMGNRYGKDGITFDSTINTSNGHIEICDDPVDEDFVPLNVKPKNSTSLSSVEKQHLNSKFFELEG